METKKAYPDRELEEGESLARLTLTSHPGQALVRRIRSNENEKFTDHEPAEHDGHKVDFFKLGDGDQALTVILENTPEGTYIKFESDCECGDEHSFDVAEGKMEKNNKVVGYKNHRGGNQFFVVNENLTVSPTFSPKLVLGLNKEDKLVLVTSTDKNALVFEELKPTVQATKVMALIPKNFPHMAIVYKKQEQQHGHGMEQMLTFGPPDKAIKVFLDEEDSLHDASRPFQVFDSHDHENRAIEFFAKHSDYGHQRYTINDEGSIGLEDHPDWVLGHDRTKKKIIHVKRWDKKRLIFENAQQVLGAEHHNEKDQGEPEGTVSSQSAGGKLDGTVDEQNAYLKQQVVIKDAIIQELKSIIQSSMKGKQE